MEATVIDTGELVVGERADAWVEVMAMAQVTQRTRFLDGAGFKGRITVMPLGTGQITDLSHASVVAQRTPRLVRQSDPELYHAALVTAGEVGIEQYRQNSLLQRGDIGFFDSSQPFESFTGDTATRTIVFQFPKKLLPIPERRFTSLCGLSLSTTEGVGRLFAQFMAGVAEQYGACTPRDAATLQDTLLGLLTAALRHHLDGDSPLWDESGRNTLFLRITSYIDNHLADPDLGPEAIASAQCISVRYLHRIFQQNGTTPRAFIRQQRLENCRRDLADPALRHLSVHAIACRWGYPQADTFSRAFRSFTGMSPSEYRVSMGTSRDRSATGSVR
ncbi:helix-turn-helix domain-containing protein [Streptomyces sp. SA15]|uniref:helix-turn-helix domain-containing protein n=1 Tax=Streptomyces sp. SA15 TaxID=934019 RepID=UPI0015C7D084|nr:helix-turn-helix domain-containing protein [Streptomyces sp. SA15]